MIDAANKQNGKMTDDVLVDMELTENESAIAAAFFKKQLEDRITAWTAKNPTKLIDDAPWYTFIRNSIWQTFKWDFISCALIAFIAEAITVTYVFFMFYLITYLKNPDAPYTDGIWICAVYSFAVFISTVFRNKYIFDGYLMAIKMRKVVVSNMYDKVGKLSTKSLTETNSGKLITIISGDIFNVERATCLTPILPAAPCVVLLALFYIAWGSGIEYAIITLVIWLMCIFG
jgi:ABC-type siderophore export system fused ATPase/permease subunit